MLEIPLATRAGETESLGRCLSKGIPRSYAVLFFSPDLRLGWLLLAASLMAPDLGLAGLAAVAMTGCLAWFLGYDRGSIANGYLLFNPLLVGLTVGWLHRCYSFSAGTYLALWLSAVTGGFFLAVAMQHWFLRNMSLSAHSLPAVVAAYVLYFLGFGLFGPAVYPYSGDASFMDLAFLPPSVLTFLQSMGAMLFQTSALAGIVVLLALLWTSPLSALLSVGAFASGAGAMVLLGFPLGPEGITWCGFNFLLTGIALGAGYFAPGRASFLLALAGAFLCALVAVALSTALRYFGLPASALPYNLVVLVMVFALRQRLTTGVLHPSPAPGALPESAARLVVSNARRFPHYGMPWLLLPVEGEVLVTQGMDQPPTHLGPWRHALDFEKEDGEGAPSRRDGEWRDYAVFDETVHAPCHGVVSLVRQDVEDNPPGGNNPEENWGNHVILYADAGYHVMLAHLRRNSVVVTPGQRVAPGALLGRVGNSGRSPVPHLHVHVQRQALPGAATLPFCVRFFEEWKNGAWWHRTSGILGKGARVRPAETDLFLLQAMRGWLPGHYRYRIEEEKGVAWEETLALSFDWQGRHAFQSLRTKARCAGFFDGATFYLNEFEGTSHSLLAWLFVAMPRVPCVKGGPVRWEDAVSLVPFVRSPLRRLHDLLDPFLGPVFETFHYEMSRDEEGMTVQAKPASAEGGGFTPCALTCRWEAGRGLVSVEARQRNDRRFKASLVAYQPA